LLRSLMAHLRGEPKVWSVVRVSSVAEDDARGCTVSVIVWSWNAFSTSTASRALRAPWHLRLSSDAPAGDGSAGAIAHGTSRRASATPKSEIKRELHRLKPMVEMITSYSLPASWRTPLRVRLRKPHIEQFMARFATESSYSLHRADWQVSAASGIVGRPVERRHEAASAAAQHPDNFNIEMH
jgi:hypothetical protein